MAENKDVLNLNVPGTPPMPDTAMQPVTEPLIQVEVQDRLLRELKRRLFPSDVEGILYSAITGDLYWQDQLWSLMVDKWWRLQTNLLKLKQSVSSMDYQVTPYRKADDEPTMSALKKADFVKDALFGMHGDVAFQQHDFKETLEDLVDSLISGFTVLEVYWEKRDGGIVPQCTRWLPARYYRYPYVLDDVDRLMLNPSGMLGGTQLVDFPPYKFLVCIKQSHANHPVFTAPMRCLCAWWIAGQFGLEWFMTYAQLFGIPQRVAYYNPGDDLTFQKLQQMMRQSAAATWGIYPVTTKVDIVSAAGSSGGHMPQERLIEAADKVCDILLLGQTLTTEVRDEGGNRALGTVHRKVLDEVMTAAARYCAKIVTTQIIPGIVQYNFGNIDELPKLEPVINTPIDLFNLAQSYQILFNTMKIPVLKKELYERIEFTPPEDDDDIYEPPAVPPAAPNPFAAQPQPNGVRPEPAGSPNGEKGQPKPKPNIVERVGAAFDPLEPRDDSGKWTIGGAPKKFSYLGTNQDESFCSHCGKQELKSVTWIRNNETSEVHHVGSDCAAKLLGLKASKDTKQWIKKEEEDQSAQANEELRQSPEHQDYQKFLKTADENKWSYPERRANGLTEHIAKVAHVKEALKLKYPAARITAAVAAIVGNGDFTDDGDDELLAPASVSTARKVSFALDYDEEPEPGETLRFIEAANPHRHPKTGRFVVKPPPAPPKRKVGVKRMPEVGLMQKRSLTKEDDKVCAACKDICEEGWIPVDDEFHDIAQGPPFHRNCRCSLDYKTKYRGVDIYHQATRNPYRHPETGRFVSKPGKRKSMK